MNILQQQQIINNFTDVDAVSDDGKSILVPINNNVDIDEKTIYANVGYTGRGTNRSKLYHTLKFTGKETMKSNSGHNSYLYLFEVINPDPNNPLPIGPAFKVTIQPSNIFSAKLLASLDSHKQLTFSVSESSLFEKNKTYFIRSDCLDQYVEGIATCITARHDTLRGHIVTFELSPEDYDKFFKKSHCGFTFAEKGGWFKNKEWLKFEKSKSVKSLKKRAKTPKRSKARKSVKNLKSVKSVKSLKKRAKTPKRSKA
jgi:hypothetical protein